MDNGGNGLKAQPKCNASQLLECEYLACFVAASAGGHDHRCRGSEGSIEADKVTASLWFNQKALRVKEMNQRVTAQAEGIKAGRVSRPRPYP